MADIELLIIFCFYIIGKEKDLESFTARFNKYFKKDCSSQTIKYEITKLKNADPANNNPLIESNDRYRQIWDEYVVSGHSNALRTLYGCFKSGEYIENSIHRYDYYDMIFSCVDSVSNIKDVPKKLDDNYVENGSLVYKRDQKVVANALFLANYVCECECGNVLFKRKDGKTEYTEGHHLIPLSFQKHFKFSLDVEANVVSLCPICHRRLHYGNDARELLKNLYFKRKDRLQSCELSVSYEELLLMYR